KYRARPVDAVATITSGNGKIEHQPPDFVVSIDAVGLDAGIEVTFTKDGYNPHRFRITKRDVESSAPIDVVLTRSYAIRAHVLLSPTDAKIEVANGEAIGVAEAGRYDIAAPETETTVKVVVSAPGFFSKTVDVPLNGSLGKIVLSENDAW